MRRENSSEFIAICSSKSVSARSRPSFQMNPSGRSDGNSLAAYGGWSAVNELTGLELLRLPPGAFWSPPRNANDPSL
jgi:hypothetical protein